MKWYRHECDDRNKLTSKLIRTKFGAEGYGIYQALIEVIGEFVNDKNIEEWGHVHKLHTLETLADECCTTPERLKEFLTFCDEKGIFEKNERGLYYPIIKDRLDTFFSRIKKENKATSKSIRSKLEPVTHKEEKRREEIRKEEIIPVAEKDFSAVDDKSSFEDCEPSGYARAKSIANSLKTTSPP